MSAHPFALLSPELIIEAVESQGLRCDARVLALNSFENRVYQVGLEEQPPLIAKFYRPQRLSDAAIIEEHQFTAELASAELPVAAPLQIDGRSLFSYQGYRFALFPRLGGRAVEPDQLDTFYRLGQLLGRLHQIGAVRAFSERPIFNPIELGRSALAALQSCTQAPKSARQRYLELAERLLSGIVQRCTEVPYQSIRLHGDGHLGNLLARDEMLYLLDFDDCQQGPAVQDLWMLLSGSRHEQQQQLGELLEGYSEFADFDRAQLQLIEALRGLRLLKHNGWIAQRYDDPAFPLAFPHFVEEHYWLAQCRHLHDQLAALEETPLTPY